MKPIRFISYYAALVALSFDSLSVTGFSIHAATQCSTASLTRSATTSMGDIDRAYEKPNLFLNFHHAPKMSQSRLFFTPGVEENNGEKKNESFIRPAIHNSPIFRIIAILYAVLFAVHSTSGAPAVNSFQKLGKHLIIPPKAAATAHLLSFATWFGTVVYTTFLAGITMFKNLPRRTFGTLQSKLFPLYFQLCAAMIGVQASKMIGYYLFFLLLSKCSMLNDRIHNFPKGPYSHCDARYY